jgi:hypothetical protein
MKLFTEEEFSAWQNRKLDYDLTHELALLLVYKAVEEMLRVLPGVIQTLVRRTVMLRDLTDKFYADNKDLVDHKEIVARVIEGLELKSPQIDLEQLLKEAAPLARRQVRLAKSAIK